MAKTPKRPACKYCGAKGGKRHLDSCTRPRAKSQMAAPVQMPVTKTVLTKAPAPAPSKRLRNRVAFVVDASSSMIHLKDKTIEVFNNQISELKAKAVETGQETLISVYTFADLVTRVQHQVWHEGVQFLAPHTYLVNGNTALIDATGMAISDLAAEPNPADVETSYLIVVLTDGGENASKLWNKSTLPALVQQKQLTDMWTLAVLCPPGGRNSVRYGMSIPNGNIREWELSNRGMEEVGRVATASIGQYYASRGAGQTSVKTFFTDLSKVTKQDLNKLDDLSQQFKAWTVDKHGPQVSEFVNACLAQNPSLHAMCGPTYRIGNAYYELTKPEKVQAAKELLVMDRTTKRIYGGQQARTLLGLPWGEDVRLKPGNHANYRVFVKSTSTNRRLVMGTALLYRVR